jgi:hypothetical protein
VLPHAEACEAIKSVPIVQAATACQNPEVGVTTIQASNAAIWMGDEMDHTLVNPDQLWACGLTVDDPFSDAPIFIAMEGHEFVLPLLSKGTMLGASMRTPPCTESQSCQHVTLLSEHKWDPQSVRFPEASRAVEEEVSRSVGAVRTQGEDFDSDSKDDDAKVHLLILGDLLQRLITSVKVMSIPRRVSQVAAETHDVPQLKTFQSKGGPSSVSLEALSER